MPPSPSPAARRLRGDAGFTMIEVLVAATLLVVGVLASLMLLDTGTASTTSSLRRDTGNAIAQEVVERAQGLEYTRTRNDLTDVRAGAGDATTTPAHRLRQSMDPDGDQASGPLTQSSPEKPWTSISSWTVRRGNTKYTVTYRACTQSDVVQGTVVMGPYDCQRPATPDPNDPTETVDQCTVALTNGAEIRTDSNGNPRTAAQIADALNRGTLTVRLQLLDALGLQVCLAGLLPSPLTQGLCTLLGNSTTSLLSGVVGLANGLLSSLGSGAGIGLCPETDVQQDLDDVSTGIARTTRIETTVSWSDLPESDPPREPDPPEVMHHVVQSAVIRRAGL